MWILLRVMYSLLGHSTRRARSRALSIPLMHSVFFAISWSLFHTPQQQVQLCCRAVIRPETLLRYFRFLQAFKQGNGVSMARS